MERPPFFPFLRIAAMAAGLLFAPPAAAAEDGLDPASVTRKVVLSGTQHVKLKAAELEKSAVNFDSPDAWLFIDGLKPSQVLAGHMPRMFVNYQPAVADANVRVTAHGAGTVVIPHPPDYPALTAYAAKGLSGTATPLKCHVKHGADLPDGIRSFRLKRGYMATLAAEENGTGISKNYVAQDDDVEVKSLPEGLDGRVRFVRVFPWRWTAKKGIAGGIHEGLDVGWFYDWNIGAHSTPDLEYVPIKQKRYWPGLDHDWKAKGSLHLLGFNEPDRPDQANMTVDEAIAGWPELLGTGLRVGSPAVSDGGLGWLYQFMEKAGRAKLRVDFVVVHYYRAVPDPGDGRAAAAQFHDYLKAVHERTGRPVWVKEWNNGANWTEARDPEPKEQRRAIEAMVEMLDKAPFVERYALYNWVEESRELKRKDGSLTPAGEVYRDQESPPGYRQEKY